jgi:molybdopterin molybdotransferase
MIKPFLRVASITEALEQLKVFKRLSAETSPIDGALLRVLAQDISATEDLPEFNRSTMDGFAVRSRDTFGSTESTPSMFHVVGEIRMGEISGMKLKKGQTARIWTGGALPEGADAVVMVEHAEELDDSTVELLKAVAPFDNVVRKGEDFRAGDKLLKSGRRLRPPDIGLLAAMGISRVSVFKRPTVAIISSGDEIVPVDQVPPQGCVRDINRHTLTAMVTESHAKALWIGIAPDSLGALSKLLQTALDSSDIVIVSGGSSMGSRDHVIEAIQAHGNSQVLLHGVSISPGKPLIIARIGDQPVIGLPGHPVSAMVCFEQFVAPLIRRLEGENILRPFMRPSVEARLNRNVASKEGRTDFVRIRLDYDNGGLLAIPVPGKSGVISGMVRAHGFVRIGPDCEGLYRGDKVIVNLIADWSEESFEKKHLPGHEAAGRSSGNVLEPAQQENLSKT